MCKDSAWRVNRKVNRKVFWFIGGNGAGEGRARVLGKRGNARGCGRHTFFDHFDHFDRHVGAWGESRPCIGSAGNELRSLYRVWRWRFPCCPPTLSVCHVNGYLVDDDPLVDSGEGNECASRVVRAVSGCACSVVSEGVHLPFLASSLGVVVDGLWNVAVHCDGVYRLNRFSLSHVRRVGAPASLPSFLRRSLPTPSAHVLAVAPLTCRRRFLPLFSSSCCFPGFL